MGPACIPWVSWIFVLVLTGIGTRVKQIHHVPLNRALLPSKHTSEGVRHCVHRLTAAHLPTAQ